MDRLRNFLFDYSEKVNKELPSVMQQQPPSTTEKREISEVLNETLDTVQRNIEDTTATTDAVADEIVSKTAAELPAWDFIRVHLEVLQKLVDLQLKLLKEQQHFQEGGATDPDLIYNTQGLLVEKDIIAQAFQTPPAMSYESSLSKMNIDNSVTGVNADGLIQQFGGKRGKYSRKVR